jgi:hypothetical protein
LILFCKLSGVAHREGIVKRTIQPMTTKQQTASHEMIVKKNFNQSSMANTQHYGAEHPAMTTIFIS